MSVECGDGPSLPQVPRTFHNGIKGTFMDRRMHDKRFKNIDYNTDPSFSWQNLPAPAGEERYTGRT